MVTTRFFYVKREGYSGSGGFCIQAGESSEVLQIDESKIDTVPKPGTRIYIKCDNYGMEDCMNCGGFEADIIEVREYNQAFKEMLETAKRMNLLERILNNLRK